MGCEPEATLPSAALRHSPNSAQGHPKALEESSFQPLLFSVQMAQRRSFLAVPTIVGLVSLIYLGSFGLGLLMGLPGDLAIPLVVRLVGVPLIIIGLAMMAWVIRFRGFHSVLDSTYVTILKLLKRLPLEAPGTRTEPLVVAGPYRLVRHPLYSGVIGLTLGIGILDGRSWALMGAIALWAWLTMVLAPFEERELEALFGDEYVKYMRTHRRFLPIPRRRASR